MQPTGVPGPPETPKEARSTRERLPHDLNIPNLLFLASSSSLLSLSVVFGETGMNGGASNGTADYLDYTGAVWTSAGPAPRGVGLAELANFSRKERGESWAGEVGGHFAAYVRRSKVTFSICSGEDVWSLGTRICTGLR